MTILDMYKYIQKDSFNSNKIHHSTIVPPKRERLAAEDKYLGDSLGLGEGEAALLYDVLPPVAEELLGVLVGGDHNGTGGHDLGKARHQAGE